MARRKHLNVSISSFLSSSLLDYQENREHDETLQIIIIIKNSPINTSAKFGNKSSRYCNTVERTKYSTKENNS